MFNLSKVYPKKKKVIQKNELRYFNLVYFNKHLHKQNIRLLDNKNIEKFYVKYRRNNNDIYKNYIKDYFNIPDYFKENIYYNRYQEIIDKEYDANYNKNILHKSSFMLEFFIENKEKYNLDLEYFKLFYNLNDFNYHKFKLLYLKTAKDDYFNKKTIEIYDKYLFKKLNFSKYFDKYVFIERFEIVKQKYKKLLLNIPIEIYSYDFYYNNKSKFKFDEIYIRLFFNISDNFQIDTFLKVLKDTYKKNDYVFNEQELDKWIEIYKKNYKQFYELINNNQIFEENKIFNSIKYGVNFLYIDLEKQKNIYNKLNLNENRNIYEEIIGYNDFKKKIKLFDVKKNFYKKNILNFKNIYKYDLLVNNDKLVIHNNIINKLLNNEIKITKIARVIFERENKDTSYFINKTLEDLIELRNNEENEIINDNNSNQLFFDFMNNVILFEEIGLIKHNNFKEYYELNYFYNFFKYFYNNFRLDIFYIKKFYEYLDIIKLDEKKINLLDPKHLTDNNPDNLMKIFTLTYKLYFKLDYYLEQIKVEKNNKIQDKVLFLLNINSPYDILNMVRLIYLNNLKNNKIYLIFYDNYNNENDNLTVSKSLITYMSYDLDDLELIESKFIKENIFFDIYNKVMKTNINFSIIGNKYMIDYKSINLINLII